MTDPLAEFKICAILIPSTGFVILLLSYLLVLMFFDNIGSC